jgi:hypothetical protein
MGDTVRTGHDLARELDAQFGRPDPTDWARFYTPDMLEEYRGEVEDLEAQLDAQHPGWRKREPFHKLPEPKLVWVKARLKRRAMILEGRGAWGVVVVRTASGVMAVPVKPAQRLTAAFRPLVSVPVLVQQMGLPKATIDAALATLPTWRRDVRSWIRSCVSGPGVESAAAPPFPPPAAPPGSLLSRGEA